MHLETALALIRRELPGAAASVSEHLNASASGRVSRSYTLSAKFDGRTTEVLVMQADLAAAVAELVRRVRAKVAA